MRNLFAFVLIGCLFSANVFAAEKGSGKDVKKTEEGAGGGEISLKRVDTRIEEIRKEMQELVKTDQQVEAKKIQIRDYFQQLSGELKALTELKNPKPEEKAKK